MVTGQTELEKKGIKEMDWEQKSVGGRDGADGKLRLEWQNAQKEVQCWEIKNRSLPDCQLKLSSEE